VGRFAVRSEQRGYYGAWNRRFGNEHAAEEQNLTYGTARVVTALATLAAAPRGGWFEPYFERALNRMLTTGVRWLLRAQQRDGGWSGSEAGPVSVEETSLALTALAATSRHGEERGVVERAIARGTDWLIERVKSGSWRTPAPIGFYFARLWYYEKLYPMIFATGALRSVNKSFH
jgi:squalene-hopene/tetraprenyl-beta-curcumene cyclase